MSRLAVSAGRPTARFGWVAVVALTLGGSLLGQQPDPADKYKIDANRFQFTQVEDDAPVRAEDQNRSEYEAYNEVLLHAQQFTVAELEKHASRDVTFLDLVRPIRRDYQFELVYFEGRLARLRRVDPNKRLADAGVKNLYEGWMFPPNGSDPLCVLTTELPADLKPSLDYEPRPRVAIAGYSFKLIRYESSEKHPNDPTRYKVRRAPLLMARSFTLLPETTTDGGQAWRTGFLPGMLGILAGIVLIGVVLTVLFRRGDRAARRAIEHRREHNPFEGEPGPSG